MDIKQKLKTAFQALSTKPLFQTKDAYGDIYVFQERGLRVLSFDERFEQSSMNIKAPHQPVHQYIRAMLIALAFNKPKNILHLGLGGGALIRSCAKISPDAKQIAVELRTGVKFVAQTYFLTPEFYNPTFPTNVFCDNANRFITGQKPNSFDLIYSDIYMANGMDITQKTHRYLEDCTKALSGSGWLVINFTQLPNFDDQCFSTLKRHFSTILIASIDAANHIIYAGKQPLMKPLAAYASQVKQLGEALDVPLLKPFKQLQHHHDFYHLD